MGQSEAGPNACVVDGCSVTLVGSMERQGGAAPTQEKVLTLCFAFGIMLLARQVMLELRMHPMPIIYRFRNICMHFLLQILCHTTHCSYVTNDATDEGIEFIFMSV